MRVFYDHQVTSLQDAGGLSRYYFELIQRLVRNWDIEPELVLGIEQSVMPFRDFPPPARVLSLNGSRLKPGIPRYAINEAITAMVAPLRGRYNVYHATYQRSLPYIRHSALVVTHHDSIPERFPGLFPDAAAIRARLTRLYARADRIICISEATRRDLLHFYPVHADKTMVIHQGLSVFSLNPVSARANPFQGRPFLLYVGARFAYKNFGLLLEALAAQKDRSLCLLALGGGSPSPEEDAQITRLRLEGRVQVVARATDAELAAAYQSAILFVYPSLYEGFGFPPLEAMHAGCPVIVSETSALPEICGDAAFYFDPASLEELVHRIDTLVSDEALRSSKREAGFAQVQRYTWEKTAEATFRVYQAALSGK